VTAAAEEAATVQAVQEAYSTLLPVKVVLASVQAQVALALHSTLQPVMAVTAAVPVVTAETVERPSLLAALARALMAQALAAAAVLRHCSAVRVQTAVQHLPLEVARARPSPVASAVQRSPVPATVAVTVAASA
jgi:hypothetical protein